MLSVFLQGFFLQASLILALGAQNIFVLNSGLRKQHHLLVALVSALCDMLLVFVGVLGIATFFIKYPYLKIGLGVVGVGFLFFYGIKKIKESKNKINHSVSTQQVGTAKQATLTSFGFSLLNPHVYLDTIVLIGGYSAKFNFLNERFYFGAGASAFSFVWFFGLVLLASFCSRFLNSQKAMSRVSFVSGVILVLLSFKLGSDVFGWFRGIYS